MKSATVLIISSLVALLILSYGLFSMTFNTQHSSEKVLEVNVKKGVFF